jgi:hypothetical protein
MIGVGVYARIRANSIVRRADRLTLSVYAGNIAARGSDATVIATPAVVDVRLKVVTVALAEGESFFASDERARSVLTFSLASYQMVAEVPVAPAAVRRRSS